MTWTWVKKVSAVFGYSQGNTAFEPIDKTDDSRNALKVEDQHTSTGPLATEENQQTDALTDAELRASDVEVNDDAAQALLTTIESNQLPDGHNVTVTNPTADPETGLAKESKQLPDNHQVAVSNQPSDFPDSAAKQILDEINEGQPNVQKNIEFLPDRFDPTTIYVGVAARGVADAASGWTIKKITIADTLIDITRTDEDTANWDNRATETYS